MSPDPGPGTAREWLRRELSHREYQRSLVERFWDWVRHLLDRVQDSVHGASTFSPLVAVAVVLALVAVIALVVSRLRTDTGRAEEPAALFTGVRRSAADHRAAARAALERREWDECVLESVRALAADLFERAVVAEEPGATAHEIATSAAGRFPAQADRLHRTVRVFDEARYGDRPAGEQDARAAYELAEELRSTTPASIKVTEALANPKPVQRPHPPILIGGGASSTLRLVAEHADIWNHQGGDPTDGARKGERLDAFCEEIGRDPATITRSMVLGVAYDDPARTRAEVAAALEAGFSHLVLALPAPYPDHVAQWLVDEVVRPSAR